MRLKIPVFIFVFTFSLSLISQDISKIDLSYSGSSTVGNFIQDVIELDKYSFRSDTRPESSGGELAIMEGRTDLAGIARIPSKELLSSGVSSTLIGWDAIAIIVHPDNPIKNLTSSQLKAIYTGEVRNWQVYGGPDLEITPYIVGPESATRKVCRSIILGKDEYHNCEEVRPDVDILERVKNDVGGIGQISYSFVRSEAALRILQINGQILTLSNSNYPITRPLYLLWWPGRKDVAEFVNWTLSSEGQDLVRQRFVGIREASVQTDEETGELVVYTKSKPMEDGGIFYYPHDPYDVLNTDGTLVLHVKNHLSFNDESPSRVSLSAGNYLIRTDLKSSQLKEFSINIKSGQITRIYTEQNEAIQEGNNTNRNSLRAQSIDREGNSSKNQLFNFFGDFRVRAEEDMIQDQNRFRGRFRIRAGIFSSLTKDTKLEIRLVSTTNPDDPNSTHVNLDGGFNQIRVAIDRAYFHYHPQKSPYFEWWIGKFSNPNVSSQIFSELVWDADIQPEGTAFSIKKTMESSISQIKFINGTYLLSQFKTDNTKNWLNTTQVSAELKLGEAWKLSIASGLYFFKNIKGLDLASSVVDQNEGNATYITEEINNEDTLTINRYLSNFYILDNFFYLKNSGLKRPLIFKFQWINNVGADNENSGFSAGISYGDLKDKNHWLFYYQYHYLQKDAVFTPYVQDDFLKKTNASGHVFGIAHSFHKKISVNLWALVDKSLDTGSKTDARIRLDLNVKI
jgi:phosphate transport system substrate-binding protein